MEPELRDIIIATRQDMLWVKDKMGGLCKTVKDQRRNTNEQYEDLEERVDKLESFKDRTYVLLALAGTGIGGAWAKISKLF